MPSGIIVREERPEDLDGIQRALIAADFGEQAWSLGYRTDRYYDLLVAVDEDGTVLGMIDGHYSCDYDERIAEHVHPPQTWGSILAVAPEHRRRGAGRALLAEFARRGKAAGSTYFVAKVDESNEPAGRMAFFASCGLRPVMPDRDDDVVAGPLEDVISACS